METIEFEKTYLIKFLPKDLTKSPHKEILDIYLPEDDPHPLLRLRQSGDKFEITRKDKINNDNTEQKEFTIVLTREQFAALAKVEGKRVHKIRYYYPYEKYTAEIDLFLDELAGLAIAEVEFSTSTEKASFSMPEFCLRDVDDEEFLAGGMLAGKTYKSIEKRLKKLGSKNISKQISNLLKH